MAKIFVVYTMLFGYGVPTHDDAHFSNLSGCELWLHTQYGDEVVESFKLACVDISPTLCQGHVCQ